MKVQFNCRLDQQIADWIAEQAEKQSKQRGKKVSQADVIKMLVLSSPFNPVVYSDGSGLQLRASDATVEHTTSGVVIKPKKTARVKHGVDYGSSENWRSHKTPLLKPKERK